MQWSDSRQAEQHQCFLLVNARIMAHRKRKHLQFSPSLLCLPSGWYKHQHHFFSLSFTSFKSNWSQDISYLPLQRMKITAVVKYWSNNSSFATLSWHKDSLGSRQVFYKVVWNSFHLAMPFDWCKQTSKQTIMKILPKRSWKSSPSLFIICCHVIQQKIPGRSRLQKRRQRKVLLATAKKTLSQKKI